MRKEDWLPIKDAPKGRGKDGKMQEVLLIASYPKTHPITSMSRTWSDVYHSWWDSFNGETQWVRWPHAFPPTHWMPIVTPEMNTHSASPYDEAASL